MNKIMFIILLGLVAPSNLFCSKAASRRVQVFSMDEYLQKARGKFNPEFAILENSLLQEARSNSATADQKTMGGVECLKSGPNLVKILQEWRNARPDLCNELYTILTGDNVAEIRLRFRSFYPLILGTLSQEFYDNASSEEQKMTIAREYETSLLSDLWIRGLGNVGKREHKKIIQPYRCFLTSRNHSHQVGQGVVYQGDKADMQSPANSSSSTGNKDQICSRVSPISEVEEESASVISLCSTTHRSLTSRSDSFPLASPVSVSDSEYSSSIVQSPLARMKNFELEHVVQAKDGSEILFSMIAPCNAPVDVTCSNCATSIAQLSSDFCFWQKDPNVYFCSECCLNSEYFK